MDTYYVFVYESYYPLGGLNDYVGCANSLEEARILAKNKWNSEYYQIADSSLNCIEEGSICDI